MCAFFCALVLCFLLFTFADFDEDENIEFTIEGDIEVRLVVLAPCFIMMGGDKVITTSAIIKFK